MAAPAARHPAAWEAPWEHGVPTSPPAWLSHIPPWLCFRPPCPQQGFCKSRGQVILCSPARTKGLTIPIRTLPARINTVLPWECHGRGLPGAIPGGSQHREGSHPGEGTVLRGISLLQTPQLWRMCSSPARDKAMPGCAVGPPSQWETPLPPHPAGTSAVVGTAPCPGCAACHRLVLF